MAVELSTRDSGLDPAPEGAHRATPRWLLAVLIGLVVAMGSVIVWLVVGGDESNEAALPPGLRPVPAEVESDIDALVDRWMAAWNEHDGEAARALFTDDFRYVRSFDPTTTLEGYDVDRMSEFLSTQVFGVRATATDRVIVERVGVYFVAQKYQAQENTQFELLELYTIVDDGGVLKFRYIEGWAPLGWQQTAEGQPYQAIENQLLGWPYGYVRDD